MTRTKGEQALDEQNRLLRQLREVEETLRRQKRTVSASATVLRRLITAEEKRLQLVRKELDRQRAKGR